VHWSYELEYARSRADALRSEASEERHARAAVKRRAPIRRHVAHGLNRLAAVLAGFARTLTPAGDA
jgi:hypothetical protein